MIFYRNPYFTPCRKDVCRRFERIQTAKHFVAYFILLPIIIALALPAAICNKLFVWFRLLREW